MRGKGGDHSPHSKANRTERHPPSPGAVADKRLIEIHEQTIKAKIAAVWGE